MMYLFIILLVCVIINALAATQLSEIAEMKGHKSYWSWCFWLGLPGWLMVVALPDRSGTAPNRQTTSKSSAPDGDLPDL